MKHRTGFVLNFDLVNIKKQVNESKEEFSVVSIYKFTYVIN